MQYRTLGKTGLKVSEIGFGGEWLERHDEAEAVELLRYAGEKGVNIVDCWMPDPKSRDIIGKAMEGKREKWIVQGHIGSTWQNGQYVRTRDVKQAEAAFEDILRRMKTDKSVIDSLPDKTEMPLECRLTPRQAAMYTAVTDRLAKELKKVDTDEEGNAKRRMIVLSTIMMLKQICNHPAQAGSGDAWDPALSGKFQAVGELCETIASRQEKLLVFSQFRETVEPLADFLAGIFRARGLVMHGGIPVKKRQALVNAFQTPDGPPFMVLTIKVGGTGLTLTEASHAFRIGQKRNVLVHKCLVKGTVEEQIDKIIQEKRQLADDVLGTGAEVNIASLSDEEIFKLVRLDAAQVLE